MLRARELRVVMAGKLAQIGNVVKVILGPPKLSQHVGKYICAYVSYFVDKADKTI